MLGRMRPALYLIPLVIGLNIDTAVLSMISGSGKIKRDMIVLEVNGNQSSL